MVREVSESYLAAGCAWDALVVVGEGSVARDSSDTVCAVLPATNVVAAAFLSVVDSSDDEEPLPDTISLFMAKTPPDELLSLRNTACWCIAALPFLRSWVPHSSCSFLHNLLTVHYYVITADSQD